MEVCTIIAKNYLAHARVLARSLAEHNPQSRLWTLIIDDYGSYVEPGTEPFEVLAPGDIRCDAFAEMALRYTVLELSTAVKPWLLRHLMELTGGPVTYLDPDIRVYGPMDRLDALGRQHGVALIPHNNVPIPPDGRRPSQVDVMIAGVYNLGYVTVAPGPQVDQLLDWWADRLRRDCRVDPIWGYFVDQRWFDLVPGFLTDFAIIRDPEYNVAYWNLHSRELEISDGRYLVDGRPLAFFHFSGFDPRHPLILSRHQDRIDVAEHPALERLLAGYAREVMDQGHAVSRQWPYTYRALGDGTEIDEWVRRFCREFADEYEHSGRSVLSPFTVAGARRFQEWLASDAPDAPPGINRVLARVYQQRADLQDQYPDLSGPDRDGLLEWAREFGVREVPLLANLSIQRNGAGHGGHASDPQGWPRPRAASSAPVAGRAGVNVVGSFASQGEAPELARQMVRVLDELGIPAVPVDAAARDGDEQDHPFPVVAAAGAAYGVNLICLPASAVADFARQAGARFFAGRYSIALWLGPTHPEATSLGQVSSLVQEIWTPSAALADTIEPKVQIPVHAVPFRSSYVSGQAMRRRLESIRATGRVTQDLPPRSTHPRGLAQARAIIKAGPADSARSGRALRARDGLRKAVLRALRPYTSYQERANSAILTAIEDLTRTVDRVAEDLRSEAAAERAELLREMRKISDRVPAPPESRPVPSQEPASAEPTEPLA